MFFAHGKLILEGFFAYEKVRKGGLITANYEHILEVKLYKNL